MELNAEFLFREITNENVTEEEQDNEVTDDRPPSVSPSAFSLLQHPLLPIELPIVCTPRTTNRKSTSSRPRPSRSTSVSSDKSRSPTSYPGRATTKRYSKSVSKVKRSRIWKQTGFTEKPHHYPTLSIKPVRRPLDYFNDYFDTEFLEKIAHCTNLYYQRTTGRELKSTSSEIAKLFAIHIIMGCISYPRVACYWRTSTKLGLISELMTRDRFFTLRNALHVVNSDAPAAEETDNPLWKVQPMIDKVKDTCNKLERVPGYYSVHEQIIPFTGHCKLRRAVKNKTRRVGLKNFVLTTSEGLMLDFDIYKGANSNFVNSNLGLGPSVILHLVKSVPRGSCVYHDRYFTTIPLIEEMEKLGLHSTGTIMQNRIPDRASIEFKKDKEMQRGESQQFICYPTAIVKWRDNKSVLLASNCAAADEQSDLKTWHKKQKGYINIAAPKIVRNYNQHIGGVNVLHQQMEYYRAFIKTKKWTLKVLIHFLDLSVVNAWRLYRNDCLANKLSRKDSLPLLDFRMNVADSLASIPGRARRESCEDDDLSAQVPRRDYKIYRPTIAPPEVKRYDGYEHYPVSDDIKAPRSCRLEECGSRSKIRCEKCDVYLCLSRDKDCFKIYHSIKM